MTENEVDSDNGDGVIYANDASNGLSAQKCQEAIDLSHPRMKVFEDGKVKLKKFPVCKTKFGMISCRKQDRRSDIQELGAGVVAYFQFLKFLAIVFLVMSIISIPSMLVFISGNVTTDASGFKSLITKLSLGNVGELQPACGLTRLTTLATGVNQGTFQLDCSSGTLDQIESFGQLSVNTIASCASLASDLSKADSILAQGVYPETCILEEFKEAETVFLTNAFTTNCVNKTTCSFQFTDSQLPSSKCSVATATPQNWQYLLITSCKAPNIQMFGYPEITVTKEVAALIVVFLDIIISYFLWFSLLSLGPFQEISETEIDQETITAADFTVQIVQHSHQDKMDLLKPIYWSWAEQVLAKDKSQELLNASQSIDINQNYLTAVNIGESSYGYMKIMEKLGKLIVEKKKLQIQLEKTKFKTQDQRFLVEAKIDLLQKTARTLLEQIEKYKQSNKPMAVYAFLQFQSMNGKRKFMKAMNVNCCKRNCLKYCLCLKHRRQEVDYKFLGDRWPIITDAPDPTQIIWNNLGIDQCNRCIRGFLIYVVLFAIVVLGFIGIVFAYNYQHSLQKVNWSPSQCNGELTKDMAYLDYLKGDESQNYIPCYCYQQLKLDPKGVLQITFANGSKLCNEWVVNYTKIISTLTGISLSISFINYILKYIIRFLTKMEGNHTIEERLQSQISKLWIVSFVNTALVILVINANLTKVINLPEGFPILAGQYYDFGGSWFASVGSTISVSCFIACVMPITNIISAIVKQLGTCLDRGCTNDLKKTKKLLQQEYEAQYLGDYFPIQDGYSTLISVTFIILMYSSAIPLLYLSGFFLCIILYWTDKVLLLRFNSTPPKFDLKLATRSRKIMEFAVLLHMLVALYMLSNPNILVPDTQSALLKDYQWLQSHATQFGKFVSRWTGCSESRFQSVHAITYGFATAIFLTMLILQHLFRVGDLLLRLFCICLRRQDQGLESAFSTDIYHELYAKDLYSEYNQTVQEIQKITNLLNSQSDEDDYKVLLLVYVKQLETKLQAIKLELGTRLKLNDQLVTTDLQKDFITLQLTQDGKEQKFFLEGLHSYDILHNKAYKRCLKVESRLVAFKACQ